MGLQVHILLDHQNVLGMWNNFHNKPGMCIQKIKITFCRDPIGEHMTYSLLLNINNILNNFPKHIAWYIHILISTQYIYHQLSSLLWVCLRQLGKIVPILLLLLVLVFSRTPSNHYHPKKENYCKSHRSPKIWFQLYLYQIN